MSPKLIMTIKEFGGNLEVFQFFRNPNCFDFETLKKELKDVFDEFEKQENFQLCIAKKAGAVVNFKFD
jgi:hypothetical protein